MVTSPQSRSVSTVPSAPGGGITPQFREDCLRTVGMRRFGFLGNLLTTGVARVVGALGGLVLSFLIARHLGPSGLGAFAFAQAVCTVIVIISRRGYDVALMRSVSRALSDENRASARGSLRFALRGSARLGVAVAVVTAVVVFLNPVGVISGGARYLLLLMLTAVPTLALLWQFSGFFKGLHRASLGILFEQGGAALATAGIFQVVVLFGVDADLTVLGFAFLGGSIVLLATATFGYRRWAGGSAPSGDGEGSSFNRARFDASGREFLVINVGVYMTQAGSFVLAGLMLPEEQVGLLKAAERLTLAVSFWPSVVNPIIAPKIAAFYDQNRREEIGRMTRRASLFCLLAASPFVLSFMLFPEFFLGLFGAGFDAAAVYLQVMSLGHLVIVSIGISVHVLTMSQYENIVKRVTVGLFALSVVAFPVMIVVYGALGFALVSTGLLVLKGVISVTLVWRKLGLWTAAGPDLEPWLTR